MKVLFISSGNSTLGISPIVKNQGISLVNQGVELDYFTIKGKGFLGYIKIIPKLRKHIKNNKYEVIHAHYSLSAFAASLAGAKPLVVSLMGSDLNAKKYYKYFIKLFSIFFWSEIIVKSKSMKKALGINSANIIPNGVDFNICKPIDKRVAIKKTGWNLTKKHILFAANPNREVKNFKLAKEAFDGLSNKETELKYFDNVPFSEIAYYYNSANVVLLTSLWEGSPNVIKEAMACNIPIVSTDVGDVKEIINNTIGCYIADNNSKDISLKIFEALKFNSKTSGREDIKHLESSFIAKKIINIYKLLQ